MHLAYVVLHDLTWCMVVWCTQNVLRWQRFHVAPAMPVDIQNALQKAIHSCRITCEYMQRVCLRVENSAI